MDKPLQTMADYYARRASEYERVYQKPERLADLGAIERSLSTIFTGQDVLEVACGTGYWTQFIAGSAKSIVATDYNTEVLEIARQKDYGSCDVTFIQADAYSLEGVDKGFTAGFHGFWWSHIPVHLIPSFVECFHGKLSPDAMVVMLDNCYVEGSSTVISRRDENGNTYQTRKLEDGSSHEVLKNFPSASELTAILQGYAHNLSIKQLDYYWLAQYRKGTTYC